MITERAAQCLVQVAADGILSSPEALHEVLDELASPIYSTDRNGTLTYFNHACIRLAGRTPQVGTDKWCVTWKIYTTEGEYLPHDACPMAVAIREKRAIRGVEAVAERPDGSRINFMPFPTPVFDSEGQLAGAVNLLLDITSRRKPDDPTDVPSLARLDNLRGKHLESLARMAAHLAGRNPDDHATIRFGDVVAFDDVMWRYPDFLARAEAAYRLLESADLPVA
jgi:PAS domain S-box-containing protein